MEKALVVGASGGIGQALVAELAQRYDVTALSRRADGLDVTDEASVAATLGALQEPFARIIVATGALEIDGHQPERTIKALEPEAMMAQFRLNTLGPALVLKHVWRLIPRKSPSVVAVLSARVGSIGDNKIGGWVSYRTAKAGVNQVVHTAAIELARTHKQACLIALHPGTVATPFTQKYLGRYPSVPPQEAAANLAGVLDARRPEDTGQFYDWANTQVPW